MVVNLNCSFAELNCRMMILFFCRMLLCEKGWRMFCPFVILSLPPWSLSAIAGSLELHLAAIGLVRGRQRVMSAVGSVPSGSHAADLLSN